MPRREHWEAVYRSKSPTEVSWYQSEATLSMRLITQVLPSRDAPIIDVGGGASVLVAELLAAGYSDLTVLDLSGAALEAARTRLGPAAGRVEWMEGDVLTAALPREHFALWHDRAHFHFLTEPADRDRYLAQVTRSVAAGGYVLVATFAEDGPPRCSGLDVVRYSPASLQAAFGDGFSLVEAHREAHRTPWGSVQTFVYGLLRRQAHGVRHVREAASGLT